MNIVLLADNRKNELLVNFCIAYSQILSRHNLFSLFTTARLINDSAKINVDGLAADLVSGLDQLASRVHYNEIDAVIYLRDPLLVEYDLPIATNIATSELLVLAIDRGDLDWRELVR